MTPERLAEIRAGVFYSIGDARAVVAELLAEVDRLRSENEELQGEVSSLHGSVIAMSYSS